jgi:hypothetical protein
MKEFNEPVPTARILVKCVFFSFSAFIRKLKNKTCFLIITSFSMHLLSPKILFFLNKRVNWLKRLKQLFAYQGREIVF